MTSTICIICANQLKTENASRNRILSFASAFIQRGHQVQLISMDDDSYQLLEHPNFSHHKIPYINTKIPSFIKRAILEMKIASNAIKKANQLNCDTNLITIPSMFLLHLSSTLKSGSTKILDIRDLSWEYLSDESFVYRLAKSIFRQSAIINIKNFNIISVTNDHEFDYVHKIVPEKKIVKVPNGVSEDLFNQLSSISNNVDSTKFTVTYIGNVGLAQDLSTLVEVSKLLPNVTFNIVGDGTDLDRVKDGIDPLQQNLHFLGRKQFFEIMEIYQLSSVLYAQLTPDFSGAMPSKLYEYLATGKYVLYGGKDVAIQTLNKFENVSTIEPCNVEALKNEILDIISKQKYNHLSVDNRLKIKHEYLRDTTVSKLVDMIA